MIVIRNLRSPFVIPSFLLRYFPLPTGFLHAWNQAFVCQIPEANPADAKFAIDSTRSPANTTPRLASGRVLRRPEGLGNLRFACHVILVLSGSFLCDGFLSGSALVGSIFRPKGHTESSQ